MKWNLIFVVGVVTTVAALGADHTGRVGLTSSSGRDEARKLIYPEKYSDLVDSLEEKGRSVDVIGVTTDSQGRWVTKKVNVGSDKWKDLQELLKEVQALREPMNAKECNNDSANKAMKHILDSYIDYLHKGLVTGLPVKVELEGQTSQRQSAGNDGAAGTRYELEEKVLITYTQQLRKLIAQKQEGLSGSKEKFADADNALAAALNKIEFILWGNKLSDSTKAEDVLKKIEAREKDFPEAKALLDKQAGGLKTIVDAVSTASKNLSKLKDESVCVLSKPEEDKPEEKPEGNKPNLSAAPVTNNGATQAAGSIPVVTGGNGGPGAPAGGANPDADKERLLADLQRQVAQQRQFDQFDDFDDLDRDQETDDLIRDLANRAGNRTGGNREQTDAAPQLTMPGIQLPANNGSQQAAIPPMPVYQPPEPFPYQQFMGQNQQPVQQPQIINADTLGLNRRPEPAKTGPDALTQQLMAQIDANNAKIAELQKRAATPQGPALTNMALARGGARGVFGARSNRSFSRRPGRVSGASATQSSSGGRRPARVRR